MALPLVAVVPGDEVDVCEKMANDELAPLPLLLAPTRCVDGEAVPEISSPPCPACTPFLLFFFFPFVATSPAASNQFNECGIQRRR